MMRWRRDIAIWLAAFAGFLLGVLGESDAPRTAAAAPTTEPRRRPALVTLGWLGLLLGCAAVAGWRVSENHREAAIARALTGGNPGRAPVLITRFGCGGCHTIPGVPGADGQVGPALAGLRKRVFVGGVLRNTADNLVAWIVDPRARSPGTAMPVTGISPAEARDVAAYLYSH
jgi:cytochrome c2